MTGVSDLMAATHELKCHIISTAHALVCHIILTAHGCKVYPSRVRQNGDLILLNLKIGANFGHRIIDTFMKYLMFST